MARSTVITMAVLFAVCAAMLAGAMAGVLTDRVSGTVIALGGVAVVTWRLAIYRWSREAHEAHPLLFPGWAGTTSRSLVIGGIFMIVIGLVMAAGVLDR